MYTVEYDHGSRRFFRVLIDAALFAKENQPARVLGETAEEGPDYFRDGLSPLEREICEDLLGQ